jgi:hypothetical protein
MPEEPTWFAPGRPDEGNLDAWAQATALELLQLLKLLNLSGATIAHQLGIPPSLISMWLNKKRPIPDHYRAALHVWAQTTLQHATSRLYKEMDGLGTGERKRAAWDAFYAPLDQWRIEVLHAAGSFDRSIQWHCRCIGTFTAQGTYTDADLRTLESLCTVLLNHVQLKQRGNEEAGQPQEPPPERTEP